MGFRRFELPVVRQTLAAIVLMAAGHAAAADPTLVGTTTDATGINGLVVAGQAYDVTFRHGSYDMLFTGTAPPPAFLNSPNVFLTETPLDNFVTSSGITGLLGSACGLANSCTVFVPSGTYTNAFGTVFVNGAGTEGGKDGWVNFAGAPITATQPASGGFVYGVFTRETAHVPAPDMLWLTALALAGIALARHRRELNKASR